MILIITMVSALVILQSGIIYLLEDKGVIGFFKPAGAFKYNIVDEYVLIIDV